MLCEPCNCHLRPICVYFYPPLQYPYISIMIGFLPQSNVFAHVPQKSITTCAKFCNTHIQAHKRGTCFYEENAILVFRSTIKQVFTYMFFAFDISYSGIAFWDWVLNQSIFVDHLPNYAISASTFIKKGFVFCEENVILVFKSIIIYRFTCFLHLIYHFYIQVLHYRIGF